MKINYYNQTDVTGLLPTIEKVVKIASNMFALSNNEINYIIVTNEEIKRLNNQYREKDYPTDVLTFVSGDSHNLADVFISIEKCQEQAETLGHSFERELGFLTVHGLLHALGYDHQTKDEELEMTELQDTILQKAKLFR